MSDATWNDWLASRVYFLANWAKEPMKDARKIAAAEMKLIRPKKVKTRALFKNPITGTWTRRVDKSGKFMELEADPKPFKGVRRSKSTEVMERTTERYSDLMKRLAKR